MKGILEMDFGRVCQNEDGDGIIHCVLKQMDNYFAFCGDEERFDF